MMEERKMDGWIHIKVVVVVCMHFIRVHLLFMGVLFD